MQKNINFGGIYMPKKINLISAGVELVMLTWTNVPTAGDASREYQPSCEEGLRNSPLNC